MYMSVKEKIKCGQLLWEVDFDLLKSRGKTLIMSACLVIKI